MSCSVEHNHLGLAHTCFMMFDTLNDTVLQEKHVITIWLLSHLTLI